MKYFISLLLALTFISCIKDDVPENENLGQSENDIIQYLEANNLDAERTANGVYYVIDEQGDGERPTEDGYAKVDYKGYFLDGEVFDKTKDEGVDLDLLNVIPGFSEGIAQFNQGGIGTLLIPPSLGYGDAGSSNVIPGGAVLILDFELLSVTNAQNEDDIIAYLEENDLVAQRSSTGLHYIIEEEGSGDPITDNASVTVAYTGYFLNGTEFDKSDESGISFDLENLIPGFAEGITYFKEGGKGKLLLPPDIAYGAEGAGTIPRNTVLIFDIEVKTLHD